MKNKIDQGMNRELFGPDVPGYAHLNELVRQGKLAPASVVQQPSTNVRKSRGNKKSSTSISSS